MRAVPFFALSVEEGLRFVKSKEDAFPFGLPVALFVGDQQAIVRRQRHQYRARYGGTLCSADPAEIYYRRTDRAETMGYRFALYSSFDRSDGAHSGGQAAVFRFYQHVCQPGGYADRDPLFPLFSLYGL